MRRAARLQAENEYLRLRLADLAEEVVVLESRVEDARRHGMELTLEAFDRYDREEARARVEHVLRVSRRMAAHRDAYQVAEAIGWE